MRLIYSLTRGASNVFLALPYKLIYRAVGVYSPFSDEIKEYGFTKIEPTLISKELAHKIKFRCNSLPLYEAKKNIKDRKEFSCFGDIQNKINFTVPRLKYYDSDIASIKEVWELIDVLKLNKIAASYLGCDPIITTLSSWHVVPLIQDDKSEELYDYTAQSYHYDMDWISFLKVFVNLDKVDNSNGAFEYIPYSHKGRSSRYYRDVRFKDLDKYLKPEYALGDIGSIFLADTSGLHRDGRAISSCRQVLMIEFAVSTFGAKCQIIHDINKFHARQANDIIPSNLKYSRTAKLYKNRRSLI